MATIDSELPVRIDLHTSESQDHQDDEHHLSPEIDECESQNHQDIPHEHEHHTSPEIDESETQDHQAIPHEHELHTSPEIDESESQEDQDIQLEHEARYTHAKSPSIHINYEPAKTDSFYSVRLSEPGLAPPTLDEELEIASSESDRTVEPSPAMRPLETLDFSNPFVDDEQEPEAEVYDENDEYRSIRSSTGTKRTASFPTFQEEDVFEDASIHEPRSRSNSGSSRHSEGSGEVDWAGLEKTEMEEVRDEVSDESTAFLLARLEQENNALATDPRFGMKSRSRKGTRPPSMHVLKKLVSDQSGPASRYSIIPANPPPMTELEFWAALVKDYHQTAQRLPTLTSNKIKSGVPPPLRGVVWVSMVGARDTELGNKFDKLCQETSPYENLIGKDVGRSFPGVEMFRDPQGEGQLMLGRVLRGFSLYDKEIGYCQGLGFLVGPLLMQMGDKDAFCVLVKLMENYDLRSCFLPSLSGLHVRIFQFQQLLNQHMPTLAAHLASLQVEAAYLSQWFLSFFAVTCPLPMLFRIYDVILAEGASETIMRVALSLMRRNEKKIMASREFEEVMQLLLSRSLWEAYAYDADELVSDFMEMTGLVTLESLKTLEASFKATHGTDPSAWFAFLPDATAAASRFLGRIWTASTPIKGGGLSVSLAANSRPGSFLRRSPSKQSIAASINSTDISSEGSNSVGTRTTDATAISRESGGDGYSMLTPITPGAVSKEDKDLHSQIEDLLTALSDMQRQHAVLSAQLQREREERSEDFQPFEELVNYLRLEEQDVEEIKERPRSFQFSPLQDAENIPISDRPRTMAAPKMTIKKPSTMTAELSEILERADQRLTLYRTTRTNRASNVLETKQRLRDSLIRSRGQLETEMSRSTALMRQLDEQERETAQVREHLRQAQARLQDELKEKKKLEDAVQELRFGRASGGGSRASSIMWSESQDMMSFGQARNRTSVAGLRELRLNRTGTSPDFSMPPNNTLNTGSSIPKRGSSLATQAILSTEDHAPASEDDLLVELVNTKTSEALARQELEEVKGKLDAMRRMLGVPSPPTMSNHKATPSEPVVPSSSLAARLTPTPPALPSALTGFWGWGKRSVSPSAPQQAAAGTEETPRT